MRGGELFEVRLIVGEDQPAAEADSGANDEGVDGHIAACPARGQRMPGDTGDACADSDDLGITSVAEVGRPGDGRTLTDHVAPNVTTVTDRDGTLR